MFETEPFTGPGPEAFARPPVIPASDGGQGKPFAGPETEPPPPPKTPEEVAGVAIGVAMYFEAGMVALLSRHAQDLANVGIDPGALLQKMPAAKEFVRGSTERVAIKYGISLPYQDEIVVAGALGLATFGLFGKKKKPANEEESQSNANERAARAKNANANANTNANANANAQRQPGPPPPPMGGDAVEDPT